MRLLLNNNYHISGLHSWVFISLSMKCISLIIWCTFINLSLYYFFFFYNFLSLTNFALIFFIYNFAFSPTIITRSRWLSVHTWSKLLHASYHTPTFASWALLNSAFLSTFTSTRLTNTFSINSNLGLFTNHNLFKSNFQWMLHRFHFFWTGFLATTSSSTKKLTKNIIHAVATTATIFYAFFTIFII